MADIFLSYAHEDRDRAAGLAQILRDQGWSIWWDRYIKPGTRYEDEIEHQLDTAGCVVALLSGSALTSDYVRSEMADARERGILVPALVENVRIPLSLNQTQCADLRDWPGSETGFQSLLTCIADLLRVRARSNALALAGRADELTMLESHFTSAQQGNGTVVLISGEPGIGKTALAQAFTTPLSFGEGLVLTGQCYDEQGAPPYSPWVQILNQALATVPPTEHLLADADLLLAAMNGLDLRDYGVSPASVTAHNDMPANTEYLADVRYGMFEAIISYLACAAEQCPLVIVLEDIHWSDQSTLLLLEFLTRRISSYSMIVMATYRDVEVKRKHPLFDSLARLNRQPGTLRMRLTGLTEPDVTTVLEKRLDIPAPPGLARTVYQHTNGNPLFVNELIQVVSEELAVKPEGPIEVHIPEGIREAIGHRLNRLSQSANDTLLMASLLGLDFNLTELARLLPDMSAMELMNCLEEAETTDIIKARNSLGEYRFEHALIQETLYDEIPLTRRAMLHRIVVDALEELYAERVESVLGRIAQHAYKASQAGDLDKAVDYALRAARQSDQSLAYEESLRFYSMVLDCLQMDPADRRRDMGRIYFAMGRSGEHAGLLHLDRKYAQYAKTATDLAREVGDQETFAGAACDYAKAGYFHLDAVPLLNEALALDDISAMTRTQCLCFLAIATKHRGKRTEAEELAQTAIEFADKTEGSQVALAWTQLALAGRPEKLTARLRLGERAVELAEAAEDDLAILQGYRWLIMGLMESGNLQAARDALRKHKAAAERLRSSHWVGISIVAEAGIALLDGRWQEAQLLIEEGERRGLGVYEDGASGTYAAQMHLLQRETGQLSKFAPLLIPHIRERLANPQDSQLWNLPGLCAELGLTEEARKVFREVMRDNLAVLPRDDLFSVHLTNMAFACIELGEAAFAQPLYNFLLPYANQMIVHELAYSLGPADLYLGGLATLMNQRNEASRHFENATAMAEKAPSMPWRAHTQYRYGLLLSGSSKANDQERSTHLLKSAEKIARGLSMEPLALDCADALKVNPNALPDNLTPREMELLSLIAAGRSNKDISRVLDISLNTVATHVRSILMKTHSANRTEAAAYALHKGIV